MYKITGVWGQPRGLIAAVGDVAVAGTVAVTVFSRHLPDAFLARVLGVLGLVSAGFILHPGHLQPFDRSLPAVAEGRDLNPLLQDPG